MHAESTSSGRPVTAELIRRLRAERIARLDAAAAR